MTVILSEIHEFNYIYFIILHFERTIVVTFKTISNRRRGFESTIVHIGK